MYRLSWLSTQDDAEFFKFFPNRTFARCTVRDGFWPIVLKSRITLLSIARSICDLSVGIWLWSYLSRSLYFFLFILVPYPKIQASYKVNPTYATFPKHRSRHSLKPQVFFFYYFQFLSLSCSIPLLIDHTKVNPTIPKYRVRHLIHFEVLLPHYSNSFTYRVRFLLS